MNRQEKIEYICKMLEIEEDEMIDRITDKELEEAYLHAKESEKYLDKIRGMAWK